VVEGHIPAHWPRACSRGERTFCAMFYIFYLSIIMEEDEGGREGERGGGRDVAR
jgi:hypothetical protein